jgi:type VI secretion system protein VasD
MTAIRRRDLLTLLALALPAACGGPPPPAVLTLTIVGGADQNPDPGGQPLSVGVHLFELASRAKFDTADVFGLTEHEPATLGTDDLGSQQIVVRPGETKTITDQLKPGTQFIGIAVLFRDIDRSHWRAVSAVASSGPSKLILTIQGLTATLAPG